jgi:hypothetical protein
MDVLVGRRLPAALFCEMVGAPQEDCDELAAVSDSVILPYEVSNRDLVERSSRVLDFSARARIDLATPMVSELAPPDVARGPQES